MTLTLLSLFPSLIYHLFFSPFVDNEALVIDMALQLSLV